MHFILCNPSYIKLVLDIIIKQSMKILIISYLILKMNIQIFLILTVGIIIKIIGTLQIMPVRLIIASLANYLILNIHTLN